MREGESRQGQHATEPFTKTFVGARGHRPLAPTGYTRSSTTVYRLMARCDPVGIRLITRRGNDWTTRFPLVVEAVNHLKVRSISASGWPSRAGCQLQEVANQGHPTGDAQALFGRGEDPDRLEGLRGEDSIAELCRREGIAQNLYYDDPLAGTQCEAAGNSE